ncbi:radical SAM family heme chaperone HemW [soil metagenome]
MMAPLPKGAPVGVYIHIPFCSHICPYCDFNTYKGMEALIPRYAQALQTDIDRFGNVHGFLPAGTVFFGGGTPSLLPGKDVAAILSRVRAAFQLAADAEITLEANPNSVNERYFSELLRAGVNRLSIGTQTFDRRGLRVLGRQHEAVDTAAAVEAARRAGFTNISLDLIFGWPGQTLEAWQRDLEIALDPQTGPDHLSLYSLIIEPGTPMAEAVQRGVMTPVDDDAAADLYELAIDMLASSGWLHYEVANWAKATGYGSRHNMLYWRNGEYAGFGAGAHLRISDVRRMNHLLPQAYIGAVERGEEPISNTETITPELSMGETMMLGLRLLREGVSGSEFDRRHGVSLEAVFGTQLADLAELGLMQWDGTHALLTRKGLLLANDVCARFFN